MGFIQGDELTISELLTEVYEVPDFSFLQAWPEDRSFFPRLNGASVDELELKGARRESLEAAIADVRRLEPLLAETGAEVRGSKGSLSDSISVFHRDGEVSVVAIPVTEATRLSLGGFLFSKELKSKPGADRFFDELLDFPELIEGAERALKGRRWWQRKTDEHRLDLRRAAQLMLAAQATGPAQLSRLVDLLSARIEMATGEQLPKVEDWQQALLKLEALKDLPKSSIVSTIEISEVEPLRMALDAIAAGFHRLDARRNELNAALRELQEEKIRSYAESHSLEDFARRVRGKGFPRKALDNLVYDFHFDRELPVPEPITIGDVMELARVRSSLFRTNSLKAGLKLIETHFEDQKNLLSYPRLSDSGPAFDSFIFAAYRLQLEQQRPYPARAQFDVLYKLLRDSPDQLHLIARNSDAVHRLVGSLGIYSDESRMALLLASEDQPTLEDAREFFRLNPASFQSALSNLGFNALSLEQISGFLAPELTGAIRELDLDLGGMKAQLRSYQRFGAQYALHQRRVILGDEMGLGKTITALALAKHLSNEGADRILVTLPLAVLENWRREILKHTDYIPRVLYGETMDADLELWVSEGGIAIATFESIQRVNQKQVLEALQSVDLVIVDEAHFLKNPETKRTRAVLPWIRGAERALLMTGTPLENSLDEFATLISYVQPLLELPEDTLNYSQFRKSIAPAYLRRNQADVLQELPELSEEEDYIELSEADREYYRRALAKGDWHMLRRARVLAGEKSSTVQWIQNTVAESTANGHKVLIFSYYLETIDVLRRCLSQDDPFIPLTGALSSVERQAEVDKFTAAKKPGVLLAQTTAGGTGLNIQAATVVIIVEPQSKPSSESQIIGRAHRMGQTDPVRVIRLLGKDTMDERWVDMLAEKRKIFAATAGVSDAAALDGAMGSSQTNKQILEDERKAWGL